LLFDVGEEQGFSGIKNAVNLVAPKIVIVGEPTNLNLVVGQKGLLSLKIICLGKAAHGSTPEKGISAINDLLEILQGFKGINLQKNNLLGHTTINIGTISGGTARNVIADYAEALVELRTVCPNKSVLSVIEKLVPKKNMIVESNYDPVLGNTNLEGTEGLKSITVPYFTELFFWAAKSKAFVLGPGNLDLAHTDNESINKSDLKKAVDIYYNIIKENQTKAEMYLYPQHHKGNAIR
jgi:acetylornithine deacetylase